MRDGVVKEHVGFRRASGDDGSGSGGPVPAGVGSGIIYGKSLCMDFLNASHPVSTGRKDPDQGFAQGGFSGFAMAHYGDGFHAKTPPFFVIVPRLLPGRKKEGSHC